MYLKGNQINLFLCTSTGGASKWESFAYSQNNSMRYSNTTNKVSSKDHGLHPDSEVTGSEWSMGGEYLFNNSTAQKVLKMAKSGKPYTMAFAEISQADYASGLKSVTDISANTAWTPGSAFVQYGDAIVTSADIAAQDGNTATIALELTGSGALLDTSAGLTNYYTE